MENKQLITLAYELAKTKYKDKPFTFEKLWTELIKKAKLDKDEQAIVGHVYTCMLQDHRFIFIGNSQWRVREFLNEEEIAALNHAMYDFKQEIAEEKKRLADINDREMLEQEAFYTEDELEAMYKEQKNKQLPEDDEEEVEEKESKVVEEDEEEEEE